MPAGYAWAVADWRKGSTSARSRATDDLDRSQRPPSHYEIRGAVRTFTVSSFGRTKVTVAVIGRQIGIAPLLYTRWAIDAVQRRATIQRAWGRS
jgi:hypothetical protein